jgi:hypothetical protein
MIGVLNLQKFLPVYEDHLQDLGKATKEIAHIGRIRPRDDQDALFKFVDAVGKP